MTDQRTADDVLMGSGGPTCKFETIGDTWRGTVLAKEASQQRELKTNELKVYKDGNPMMQVIVTLQTDQRDPAVVGDDGVRRLFVRGEMLKAIREAVKRAGATTVEIGGMIAVKYTGDGQSKGVGLNPPKEYAAEYRPAPSVQNTAADNLFT